ncbi:TonB-dependent receptor [Halomonas denitrificans]|nr:TonB-dependent receptor [Halomonas denitrificans]
MSGLAACCALSAVLVAGPVSAQADHGETPPPSSLSATVENEAAILPTTRTTNPSASRSALRLPVDAVVDTGRVRFDPVRPVADGRPRLAATLAFDTVSDTIAGPGFATGAEPAFSWSLDAWEMNTASLAHVQCSRATRRLESFLVEDCRIIDRPLPDNAGSLVQVRGQWLAAPGLQIGAGAFAGRDAPGGPLQPAAITSAIDPTIPVSESVEGVNMNISFGLQTRRVGDLLLDLQLERYRRSQPSFATDLGLVPLVEGGLPVGYAGDDVQTAGRLGIGWQLDRFRADLTGQYRELPYWLGEQARGQGFSSFDIELSWRAPANASISVGVSNLLDQRPDDVDGADAALDASIDRIYGRIPYVRYKHDL